MTDAQKSIMTVSEFLKDAHPSNSFETVAADSAQERKEAVRIETTNRTDEEWGMLANQVVGKENFRA